MEKIFIKLTKPLTNVLPITGYLFISIYVIYGQWYDLFLVNTDLATSVEPLKHLYTIPLAKMQQFLCNATDNEPLPKEHRTSAGSIHSHCSSTGSIIVD